ncbi:transmembrane protein 220 isoform X2 [Varanus komodoensis]|uniref:transmembrane protein 220 isoform X2 n=1 Tax=Varanus komodoensis TaxID=61221 RepID=UPI001CF770C3|nr:transmembrane protein 220 isoform X2 [Varanus komodoensis]
MGSRAESSTGTGQGASPLASSGVSRLWRLSNLAMAVFFGLAGVVQINDPDPGLWIVAYSVPAALTLVVSFNPPIADNVVWKSLSDLHSVACAVGAAILGYSLVANAQKNILHEEEGRELFGLLIVTVWMSLCRSSAKKNKLPQLQRTLTVLYIGSKSESCHWL